MAVMMEPLTVDRLIMADCDISSNIIIVRSYVGPWNCDGFDPVDHILEVISLLPELICHIDWDPGVFRGTSDIQEE